MVTETRAVVDLNRLERLLLQAGAAGRTLTYGEVLRHFGRRVGPGHVAALCRDLAEVCRRIEARGGPDLACLVVRHANGLPGAGYFATLRGTAFAAATPSPSELVAWVRERQQQAFAWCRAQAQQFGVLPADIDFLVEH
jgi:hypothetical protein